MLPPYILEAGFGFGEESKFAASHADLQVFRVLVLCLPAGMLDSKLRVKVAAGLEIALAGKLWVV